MITLPLSRFDYSPFPVGGTVWVGVDDIWAITPKGWDRFSPPRGVPFGINGGAAFFKRVIDGSEGPELEVDCGADVEWFVGEWINGEVGEVRTFQDD